MKMKLTRLSAAAAVIALLAGCGSAASTTSSTAGGNSSSRSGTSVAASSNPKTTQVKTTALKVTAPQPHSIVHAQHVTVRGTATPGASVQVQAPTDNGAPTAVSADKHGQWHARILLDRGDNSLTVQASSAGLSTDNPSRSVVIHVRYTLTHSELLAEQQKHRRPVPAKSTTTSTATTSSTATAPAGPTPAIRKAVNQLLTVDTGAPPTTSDTQAVTADFVRMQSKCRETPEKLAAEIWASDQDLKKHGLQEGPVSLSNRLASVTSALSTRAAPTDCRGLLAAYLVLREQ